MIGTSLSSVFKRLRRSRIQAALRAVQLLHFVQHSSTASQCSKKNSSHPLKSAYLELNTERSEVLEPHEMGVERRQALEYRTAVIEHRTL
jgi:CRISPR/Cas system type I-B associated protein Csh2 (Cas7 group RAMP superfamily)